MKRLLHTAAPSGRVVRRAFAVLVCLLVPAAAWPAVDPLPARAMLDARGRLRALVSLGPLFEQPVGVKGQRNLAATLQNGLLGHLVVAGEVRREGHQGRVGRGAADIWVRYRLDTKMFEGRIEDVDGVREGRYKDFAKVVEVIGTVALPMPGADPQNAAARYHVQLTVRLNPQTEEDKEYLRERVTRPGRGDRSGLTGPVRSFIGGAVAFILDRSRTQDDEAQWKLRSIVFAPPSASVPPPVDVTTSAGSRGPGATALPSGQPGATGGPR
jgi:hypothetical protein